jgi:3-deoxy-D-manno-octulosonate 8-phosphate phosphatase (KDO 8-P phosphatase)
MSKLTLAAVKKRAKKIRCLFLDIDGVMTDCKLYLAADGSELKAVNVKDGLGMKMLMDAGIAVAVISGRPSEAMQKRLESLGIQHIYLATPNKIPAYEAVQKKLKITDEQCAHIGDDIPDLPLFQRVGLAIAVADSHPKALAKAHWKTRNIGGNGAIREIVDLILDVQGKG